MATTKTESGISKLAKSYKKNESSKKTVKTAKIETTVTVKPAAKTAAKTSGLSVPVYSLLGKAAGEMSLPKSVFGVEINKALLQQALRVYLNNQKGHFSNTNTRGEVEGSTRKIYAQKGTGRARHGGIRAPLFVGGGIALGPKSRKVILDLPKKMKKAALISALSQKLLDKGVFGISGLEKTTGKTSQIVNFIRNIEKKSALIVTDKASDLAGRAVSNLKTVNLVTVSNLNVLQIIKAQSLIFTKEAVEQLESRVKNLESSEKTKEIKKEEKS